MNIKQLQGMKNSVSLLLTIISSMNCYRSSILNSDFINGQIQAQRGEAAF